MVSKQGLALVPTKRADQSAVATNQELAGLREMYMKLVTLAVPAIKVEKKATLEGPPNDEHHSHQA
jgi:hypothetical protein